MARPRKIKEPEIISNESDVALLETESKPETKPEPVVICAPSLGSLSAVGDPKYGYGEFVFDVEVKSAIDIDTDLSQEELIQIVEDNKEYEKSKLKSQYRVFEDGEIVEVVDEDSEKLDFYLGENASQLQSWVDELSQEITDPNVLIYINEGPQNRKYLSFEQYYMQNGYAPRLPKYKTWMEFYKNTQDTITEEEIAFHLKGNLRYSFEIVSPEE